MEMNDKRVEIVQYDPQWKHEFERIKFMINSYIGDLIIGIEHVGSTSIEGLAAKPIIDLDVVMESYEVLPLIIEGLSKGGFIHEGNLGVEGREAFKRNFKDEFMDYHLYVCPKNGKGHLEHLAFRDYLRTHETARKEYEELKIGLAEVFRYDRENYTENKTDFVREILSRTIA